MEKIEIIAMGEIVCVTDTEFTRQFYPKQIGTQATVEGVPESTTIDDYLMVSKADGEIMHVPRNSFSLLTKESRVSSSVKSTIHQSPTSVVNVEPGKAVTQEIVEGQMAPVNAMSLRIGAPVRLLDNESTRNRVPHLVNTIGYIREVPVHPATWFKVEFPADDNKILTFRPSALQAVDESGRPLTALAPPRPVTSAKQSPELHGQRSRANSAVSFSLPTAVTSLPTVGGRRTATTNVTTPNNYKKQQVLLTTTDPDSWIGRRVIVLTGRVKGVIGTVVSSGNGWVQLESLHGHELIAKRASELALTPNEDQNENEDNEGRHKKRLFGRFVQQQHEAAHSTFSAEPKRVRLEDYTTFAYQQQNASSMHKKASVLSPKRPNLTHWQVKLNAALFLPSATNHTFGRNDNRQLDYEMIKKPSIPANTTARATAPKEVDQNDPVCNNCSSAKFPGAKFCWNEACSASPIFVERLEKKKPMSCSTLFLPSNSKIKTSPSVEQLQQGFDEYEINQLQSNSPITSAMLLQKVGGDEEQQRTLLAGSDGLRSSNASDSSTITAGFGADESIDYDDDEMDVGTIVGAGNDIEMMTDCEDASSSLLPAAGVVTNINNKRLYGGLMTVHHY